MQGEMLQGTLDLLILRTLRPGPAHATRWPDQLES